MADAPLDILIDADCPLCRREAAVLQRMDRGRNRIRLVNIADPAFDASAYGTTQDAVMGTIHGRRGDGEVIIGMQVFRDAYAAVGLGWLFAPTGWPILRPIFDVLYRMFARRRLRLTGRGACASGACAR
ncbi:MAG: DUF393 domain-containing protein [Planctomycetes bacterium]|nr:DUF393 domain-containing protein [Planctomycetota bacterium]